MDLKNSLVWNFNFYNLFLLYMLVCLLYTFVICNDVIIFIIIDVTYFINDHIKMHVLIIGVTDFINYLIWLSSTKECFKINI